MPAEVSTEMLVPPREPVNFMGSEIGAESVTDLLSDAQGHFETGQWEQAREKVHQASRLAATLTADLRGQRLAVRAWRMEAELMRAQGQYGGAERKLHRVIKLAEAWFGSEDAAVGRCLNALGIVYRYTGRNDDALTCYERALVILAQAGEAVGEAVVLHNLAGLYFALGQLDEAEKAVRKALEMRLVWAPESALAIAADRLCLAAILTQAGNSEARMHAESALQSYREHHGSEHVEVGYCLQVLGHISATSDADHETARALFAEALKVKKGTLGPLHPELLPTLLSLITLSNGSSRVALVQEALRIAALLPKTHPLKQRCLKLTST
ncbi:tetratricopeptide repeat protein [Streptomyces collinus]|uniref:tetratricopeptide repeat protein n=1 Tax=Streptomyces collinus TaxID=42684 RepID=UPI0036E8EA38